MMKYYNIPGKLLAEFWFLWSKKGQLWGSARRRDHPFVHFFYSTMIYIIAAFVTVASLTDWKLPKRSSQSSSAYSESEASAPDETSVSNNESSDADTQVAHEVPEEVAQEPAADEVPAPTAAPSAQDGEIKAAMNSAFENGQPVRWETSGGKGYAVPSEAEASSGCRRVHYSDDSRPGWTSDPETICP